MNQSSHIHFTDWFSVWSSLTVTVTACHSNHSLSRQLFTHFARCLRWMVGRNTDVGSSGGGVVKEEKVTKSTSSSKSASVAGDLLQWEGLRDQSRPLGWTLTTVSELILSGSIMNKLGWVGLRLATVYFCTVFDWQLRKSQQVAWQQVMRLQ